MQRAELKIYTKNIAMCIYILYLLSESRQDHQQKTFIQCETILKVNDLQNTTIFNKTIKFKQKQRNLKSQQNYILHYVSLQKHTIWLQ